MKKSLLPIICILFAMLLIGCSGAKKAITHNQKKEQSVPATAQSADGTAVPGARDLPEAQPGAISGTVSLADPGGRTGNLFLFIVDNSGTSEDYRILAHTIIKKKDVKKEGVEFILNGVPPGDRAVIGVWDTSEPFCDEKLSYCEASARDGIGMSQTVKVNPGETAPGAALELH